MKKFFALVLVLAIAVLSAAALMDFSNSTGINYSPDTGNTQMFVFIGLGVVAVILLVFVVIRRKK